MKDAAEIRLVFEPHLAGDGAHRLQVSSPSTSGADYSSKEGANPPQLVIETSTGATNTPGPTPTPTALQTPTPTRTPTAAPTTPSQPFSNATFVARLLEWMATDGYYLMGFGEEGVNFIIDENGNISTEGLDPEQVYTSPERQAFTQMRNQLIFYNSEQEIVARYPTYETLNGRLLEPMNFLGFYQEQPWVDGRGIQMILPPENAADFDRFYNEGMLQFVLGQQELNEETWAEYLAGLDSLGAAE